MDTTLATIGSFCLGVFFKAGSVRLLVLSLIWLDNLAARPHH